MMCYYLNVHFQGQSVNRHHLILHCIFSKFVRPLPWTETRILYLWGFLKLWEIYLFIYFKIRVENEVLIAKYKLRKFNGNNVDAVEIRLDGPGLESRWGSRDFPCPTRQASRPIHLPVKRVLNISLG